MDTKTVKQQAIELARANKASAPELIEFYWFPDDEEVRLVEVDSTLSKTLSGEVEPFYFPPSPAEGLPAPVGIALVAPGEANLLKLPKAWGDWSKAQKLQVAL